VRYGDSALDFLKTHGGAFALSVGIAILVLYLVSHFLLHRPAAKT
jgi:hypothetical protein